jgi:hypothetical protein
MHLKKMAEALGTTTSRVMVASRPRLVFDQMAASVPEVMDGSLYVYRKYWN